MAVTFEKVVSIQKVKIVESGMPDKFISPNYNVLADRLLEVVYITSDAIGASDYSSGYSYSITEIQNRPSNDKNEVAEWLATNFFNSVEQADLQPEFDAGGGQVQTDYQLSMVTALNEINENIKDLLFYIKGIAE